MLGRWDHMGRSTLTATLGKCLQRMQVERHLREGMRRQREQGKTQDRQGAHIRRW
jgi:hypothetical protein